MTVNLNDGSHRFVVVPTARPDEPIDTTIYRFLRTARGARTSFWKGKAQIWEISFADVPVLRFVE